MDGEPIGLVSGELLESLGLSVEGNVASLEFTADSAAAFNAERPLIPSQLPEAWQEQLEAPIQEAGTKLLSDVFR